MNRACDAEELDTLVVRNTHFTENKCEETGEKCPKIRESQTETSCAPAFWIECVHEVGGGSLSTVCLGTIHAPVTAVSATN